MITSISPIDGRYEGKTKELKSYFSEYALIKYRVKVEIYYFIALCNAGLPQLESITEENFDDIEKIYLNFTEEDAQAIKTIERTTNHDVKAVEYFIKEKFDNIGLSDHKEFIHFGLTSQDINNTALPLMTMDSLDEVLVPMLDNAMEKLDELVQSCLDTPMLARTHGQPATPTTMSKELLVFMERMEHQMAPLLGHEFYAKFGGATGNFNAHYVAYPNIEWEEFADDFMDSLDLARHYFTTQIAHYDDLAKLFQNISRINTILMDFCKDMWTYISMEYFTQKVIKDEVGSSAMPHKVNPIDFENAEGNFGIANALFAHLAAKLPISRLQRDLTDSTVTRNIGVPLAHTLIALQSMMKGMSKVLINKQKIYDDLENNWAVVAEALQNILRRERYPKPYEALKALTRGKAKITHDDIISFIDGLEVSDEIKNEMKTVSPFNYIGSLTNL